MDSPFQPESIYCVVDNRTLLLGIDAMYRDYMQRFETKFLLPQVEAIVARLNVSEANVPIEGYYSKSSELTRYFKLMRALQEVQQDSLPLVENLPEFQKILEITTSPIYGTPVQEGKLLPKGRDPLAQALIDTFDGKWQAHKIMRRAYEIALDTNDISLVGLAVQLRDSILITALAESTVLYREDVLAGIFNYKYIWKVEDKFANSTNRFIEEFNKLLPKDLGLGNGIPKAEPQHADWFYGWSTRNNILGRCANLGYNQSSPRQYYHWAITKQHDELALDEFWDAKLWTTDNYRSKQKQLG